MSFTSLTFLFWFLPAVVLLEHLLPLRARTWSLTAASYVFYCAWRADLALVMLATTVVDYAAGGWLAALGERMDGAGDAGLRVRLARWRLALLALGVGTNLGLLAYYKYAAFLATSANELLAWLLPQPLPVPHPILPMGVSFYVFQSMSYTLDVYRRQVPPAPRLLDFMCFVSLFPHLACGPILRYRTVGPQIASRSHSWAKLSTGCFLLQIGLAKKLLLADNLAPFVDTVFAAPAPTTLEAWLAAVGYALQIYFDFSGYSDMAIGIGLMLGFTLPWNFDRPYAARSVAEFWRRWHISLSSWLRDYLYIALGGSRHGEARTQANLLITMLFGGLWHGASFMFLAWGLYHGLLLVLERSLGRRPLYARLPGPLQTACTFLLVLGGWVIFRSPDLATFVAMARALAGQGDVVLALENAELGRLGAAALVAGAVAVWCFPSSRTLAAGAPPEIHAAVLVLFFLAVLQLVARSYTPFLYFRF